MHGRMIQMVLFLRIMLICISLMILECLVYYLLKGTAVMLLVLEFNALLQIFYSIRGTPYHLFRMIFIFFAYILCILLHVQHCSYNLQIFAATSMQRMLATCDLHTHLKLDNIGISHYCLIAFD